ncbi:hypothetical protein scyTo_0015277 [Scyliorhinus torazame]|uniref:Uncharacterized protein n=1 Tax=Scyliorhinus torazame TaxID=75743 RepID=A0A401P7H1_SCYTO|nr:hypothetical protein [Scyliorhinus torazame]
MFAVHLFQMPVYYYPSGQYPTSTAQQFRPVASVQYNAQRSQHIPQTTQQTGFQAVLPNQQQGFQGLMGVQQPPQSQNLLNSQQGNQVPGVMVQYPAMSSYQVPMTQGSQGMPQSYPQAIMLPNQSGQGTLPATGMPVYCNVIPPSPQNNLRKESPPASQVVLKAYIDAYIDRRPLERFVSEIFPGLNARIVNIDAVQSALADIFDYLNIFLYLLP